MNLTRTLRAAGSALAVACGLTLASPPSAQADTTVSSSAYVDLKGEADTLLVTASAPVEIANKFTTDRTSTCYRVTATARMSSHIGATLWWFTSANDFCRNSSKVTYFSWEQPSHSVTSAGQLAGWQWDYWSHSKSRLSDCSVIGNSIGHFKQTYPVIGQIGSAVAKHHLETYCSPKPYHRWSS